MSDIPPPLIVEILSRLPVKSLCRFRCVSKPWLALINLPRFAKMHLISRTHKQKLILQKSIAQRDHSLYSVELEILSCLCNSIPVEIELPAGLKIDFDYYFCSMIGSCNGLLCIKIVIAASKGFLLYNPCTKEYKTIMNVVQNRAIGFGYAESIDDYKILQIPYPKNGVRVFDVYSLRKDSWISIPSDTGFSISGYNNSSVCFSGAIHFVIFYNEQRPVVIATFDLVEDKFKTLPPPDFMLNKVDGKFFGRQTYLGHLGGCLCLSIVTDSGSTELWVMKEYGVTESWTKILRTKSVHICNNLQPLCYLNNNETILVRDFLKNNLMFWDSEDEEFKDVEIGCLQDEWGVKNVYVESLVSPNCINGLTTEDEEELLGYWFN